MPPGRGDGDRRPMLGGSVSKSISPPTKRAIREGPARRRDTMVARAAGMAATRHRIVRHAASRPHAGVRGHHARRQRAGAGDRGRAGQGAARRHPRERTFGDALPPAAVARRRAIHALHAATDVYTWKLLRRDVGLSRKETGPRRFRQPGGTSGVGRAAPRATNGSIKRWNRVSEWRDSNRGSTVRVTKPISRAAAAPLSASTASAWRPA